ncbi:MAG TPA: C-type lectin domain-containing protein [Thermoanaerobaculia bacterium]|nr:C-type lectin domain-containing protein [Thermoanaerobaculia bacterium]
MAISRFQPAALLLAALLPVSSAAQNDCRVTGLRVPMPDGVPARIYSGINNAPISDHGGYTRPHQLYGLDFLPVTPAVQDVVAPLTGTIFWKTDDALGLKFTSINGYPMNITLAHFAAEGDFGEIATRHEPQTRCGNLVNVLHYHDDGTDVPTKTFTKGQTIGTRQSDHIHLSLDLYDTSLPYRIPVPFVKGWKLPGYTLPDDFRIEGRAFPPHFDVDGLGREANFYFEPELPFRWYQHCNMAVPPPATPQSSVPVNRWIASYYIINTGSMFNPESVPSYYRVFKRATSDFDKLDFDADSDLWNTITSCPWDPAGDDQAKDWPPCTLITRNDGEDKTRFMTRFESTFDFGTERDFDFEVELTHSVHTYIDGQFIPELSGTGPTNFSPPLVKTHTRTLAGQHKIKVVYFMSEREDEQDTRARLRFRWSGPDEVCDGSDNDGDGHVDEGDICQCTLGVYDEHTYRFCNTKVDQATAGAACAAIGSHLAKVETAAENTWISSQSPAFERWLGLTDIAQEDVWRWHDGTLLNYEGWAEKEPNGGTNENCGMMWPGGSWNDLNCAWTLRFVCEE